MRLVLVAAAAVLAMPSVAQEVDMGTVVKDINERIEQKSAGQTSDRDWAQTSEVSAKAKAIIGEDVQWGLVVRNQQGAVVDVFGQVPYTVTPDGVVEVPGYRPPEGARLELVPARKWSQAVNLVASTFNENKHFAPITEIPGAVGEATNYIVETICTSKSRPSEIELALVVGLSGNILVAEASTEVGSTVTWNLWQDLCPRFGYE